MLELGSYESAIAVTPSDTTVLAPTRGLYIGGAGLGALSVVMADGRTTAFAGLTVATVLPISVTKVRSTGTDVTAVVALY